jgi:hypothetical protein
MQNLPMPQRAPATDGALAGPEAALGAADTAPGTALDSFDALPADKPDVNALVLPPPAPSKPAAQPGTHTVSVWLGTSAPQRLTANLGISFINTSFRQRQLWGLAAVTNHGKSSYTQLQLVLRVDGGGRQRVRIAELRPGQTRNVKVRLTMPRGDHPSTISVTSIERRTGALRYAGREERTRTAR